MKIFNFPFIIPIIIYQKFISPLLPSSCRFYPTCSEYMKQAIQSHGVIKGLILGTKRILKCHPGYEGGHDPVPCDREG